MAPRWAIVAVTFWKSARPAPPKPKVMSGWPDWSVLGCGLVMSLPVSATLSLRTKNRAAGLMGVIWSDADGLAACSTTVPRGTVTRSPCDLLTP